MASTAPPAAFQIRSPRVFISHASADVWVARQLEKEIRARGAETFLDCQQIEHGDDFEEKIVGAAQQCSELLVLFTPIAKGRHYVWMDTRPKAGGAPAASSSGVNRTVGRSNIDIPTGP